jgi:hypothetical protein
MRYWRPDSGVSLPRPPVSIGTIASSRPRAPKATRWRSASPAGSRPRGLYGRAAELLQYQLTQRAQDVAQGPLSVKVATLHILAGRPDRALAALQETEQPDYTDQMRWDRKRVEAVALHQLGRTDAAMAALDGCPMRCGARRDPLAVEGLGQLRHRERSDAARRQGAGEPAQAAVLRQAVALAMLGREDKLQALRARYAAIVQDFAQRPRLRHADAEGRYDRSGRIGEAMGPRSPRQAPPARSATCSTRAPPDSSTPGLRKNEKGVPDIARDAFSIPFPGGIAFGGPVPPSASYR